MRYKDLKIIFCWFEIFSTARAFLHLHAHIARHKFFSLFLCKSKGRKSFYKTYKTDQLKFTLINIVVIINKR